MGDLGSDLDGIEAGSSGIGECPPHRFRAKLWFKIGKRPPVKSDFIEVVTIEPTRVRLLLEFDKPQGVSSNTV